MSDEGLRAELEKLCRDWAAEGHDGADQLSQILTAHPAEPVPVADRERAIEVGAQAIHRWDKRPVTWEQLDADTLEQYRSEAAVVVDALFAAGVFRSEVVIDHRPGETCSVAEGINPETGFPYRSEAVALDREVVLNAMIVAIYETDGQPIGLVRQQLPQHEWQLLSIAADAVTALARPEAVVKAEALREAADAYAPGSHDWHKFRQWLRDRAEWVAEAGR